LPTPVARRPERDAFREAFEAELDYVWTTLRRLGVRDADLEDVAHELWVRVYRSFAEYDRARPLRAWLFGFAFRVAADYRRLARHRFEVAVKGEVAVDPAPLPDEQLARGEARALVHTALEALDLEKRAVLVLCDLEGLSGQEAALALDVPLFTVYSRLRVARETFARAVKRLSTKRGSP
jgi:RNA polymerase sigma-70 factor (ECF subfamily)